MHDKDKNFYLILGFSVAPAKNKMLVAVESRAHTFRYSSTFLSYNGAGLCKPLNRRLIVILSSHFDL